VTSAPGPAADAAARIVATVLARPATLGAGRLVCVDGPAGSGKTTLAAALANGFRDALGDPNAVVLVHLDDVYAGWAGLAEGMRTVADAVVAPLLAGRPGSYRRYDWHRHRFAEERVVDPCRVLVLEGVGSGQASYAAAVTTLVWVEAPSAERLTRGLARDGEAMREQWLAWRTQEDAMFAREHTRERADVVVDGTSGSVHPDGERPD
jgi:uridine kinase